MAVFCFFAIMHIMLSNMQYQVEEMNAYKQSVDEAILPNIDIRKVFAVKQFMSKNELKNYLRHQMGSMM